MRRNVLATLDDNQGTRRDVPAHRGKDPRDLRRHSFRTHGAERWEELRGGKSFAAKLYAKGSDGTRGFAAGRGKPLSPEATPALHRRAASHDFGAADHGFALQPCDPPLVETPVALHNHVPIFGAADHESVLQSTPAAPRQDHESIFDLLQSPNDLTFVETPAAAQHDPKPRRPPAPKQNEPVPHRLPPGLGMTPGMRRVTPRAPIPVAKPAAAEEKEAAEVEMEAMETALEATLARARQASSRARELNAALQACRHEEEDGAAPEVAAAEPPVAALEVAVAAPATAQDQATTHEEEEERGSQAAGVAEEASLHASPPEACREEVREEGQQEGGREPQQEDQRAEPLEPRATTQPVAQPLVTAHAATAHVPRTRAPRPTLRRRATTNVGHHLPSFLRNAANARVFSKMTDSALCVLTLALTSW